MDDRRRATLGTLVTLAPLVAGATVSGCAATAPATATATAAVPTREDGVAALRAAESAFADTMARRDLAGFAACIHPDAVFINGGQPLRGREAIVAHWRRYFTVPTAPFAWAPELAEVAAGGQLGYTEGPVRAPDGAVFARFYSTWQRQPDGGWLVVFDNGYSVTPGRAG